MGQWYRVFTRQLTTLYLCDRLHKKLKGDIKMLTAMTRKEMDMLRCSDPNCKDPSHELILHSVCHVDLPVRALMSNDILEIQCAKCGKLILLISINMGYGDNANIMAVKCQDDNCKKKHYIVLPKCHDIPAVWAIYVKRTGIVELRCVECKKLVYSIEVKK